jgi:hypothetical protein
MCIRCCALASGIVLHWRRPWHLPAHCRVRGAAVVDSWHLAGVALDHVVTLRSRGRTQMAAGAGGAGCIARIRSSGSRTIRNAIRKLRRAVDVPRECQSANRCRDRCGFCPVRVRDCRDGLSCKPRLIVTTVRGDGLTDACGLGRPTSASRVRRSPLVHHRCCDRAGHRDHDVGDRARVCLITNDLDFSAVLAASVGESPSVGHIRTQDLLSDDAVSTVAKAGAPARANVRRLSREGWQPLSGAWRTRRGRTAAREAIRAQIEAILHEPDGDQLRITLKGDSAGC